MTTANRVNLWMFATQAERNAFVPANGLIVGDFCLVGSPQNLYYCQSSTQFASTWRPISGQPTTGPIALGSKNTSDTASRSVYVRTSVSFRAVLDVTPSSITLGSVSNSNWPAVPTVVAFDTVGFTFYGHSNIVTAGTLANMRGTYTIAY